ncbi:MAG: hypothetical protein P4L99_03175 [Chthoniobacter sp.]|nr:hypothetical protein [Chthoniobacter sp.]
MPSQKSKFALQFTLQKFPEHLYFWTFTWAVALDVDEACKLWDRFLHHRGFCDAFPHVSGLRVFEMHPGKRIGDETFSHGLHVHAVIDRYAPVDIVRSIWEREAKGGRLHVKKIPREGAIYIGKYLSKQRPECLGRRHLWAAFGACEASRCKDIVVNSRWTEAYKFLSLAINGFSKLRYDERARLVSHFVVGENIEAALDSIGLSKNFDGEEWRNPSADAEG